MFLTTPAVFVTDFTKAAQKLDGKKTKTDGLSSPFSEIQPITNSSVEHFYFA
jgi:hypothetical protein